MKLTVTKIKYKYYVLIWKGDRAVAAYAVNYKADVSALRKHYGLI